MNRSSTLPPYVAPPPATFVTSVDSRRPSESSSENEQQSTGPRKEKRPNVLSSLFRKKKATNL